MAHMSRSRTISITCALSFIALSGCQMRHDSGGPLLNEMNSHRTTFSGANEVRVRTGYQIAPASDPGIDPSAPVYSDETGRKVPRSYYVLYCDIYWRLNWIRGELRKGHVPPGFDLKLDNVRRELKEATVGVVHDDNYRVADNALTLLQSGWEHYLADQRLVDAGAQAKSAPWGAGMMAMQQFIDMGGFGFGAKSLANAPLDASVSGGAVPDATELSGVSKLLTPPQERAIAVALQYAGSYRMSPHDCATNDWSKAVEKINKLRDQLWLTNQSPDQGNTVSVAPAQALPRINTDLRQMSRGYDKNGTDLPGSAAPAGDPFLLPTPYTAPPTNQLRRSPSLH